MNFLFELLCCGLAYSAYCRAVHLDTSAMLRVRIAVTATSAVALYALYLRFTGWQPDHVHVILVGAAWFYLIALAKPWVSGMPPQLKKRTNNETGTGAPTARG